MVITGDFSPLSDRIYHLLSRNKQPRGRTNARKVFRKDRRVRTPLLELPELGMGKKCSDEQCKK